MAFRHVSRAIADLPNVARLKEDGAWAEHGMLPSAISETFVSHHSMATGLYAESHGIVSNHMYDTNFNGTGRTKKFEIGEEGGTGWFKGEPIWVTAERHGVRAATYQWIGGEAYIKGRKATYHADYNSTRPFSEGVDMIDGWLSGDDAPSLVMAYFPQPDRIGHLYGPDSPEYAAKVVEMDGLLQSIREMVEAHHGNLVLLSDHGMGDISKETPVYIDEVVPKTLVDRVLISSVSPQLTVYTNTSADAAAFLAALKKVENPAIKLLSLREDLPEDMHLKGGGTRVGNVVAIARKGYSFMLSRADDVCCDAEKGAFGCCGDHGYNNKNIEMRACFGAVGPAFRADSRIAKPIHNVDLYGMFCKLLNVHPSPNNGTQVPFAGVLHKSPIRERWTAVEQGWNALWRPSGTDITIYPPSQEIFPGKRFDMQVTVSLDLPGIAMDDTGLASLRFEIRRADDTWESTKLGDICPGGPAAGGGVAQVIEDMRYSVVHYKQCVLQASVVVRAVSGLRSAAVRWDVDRRRRTGDGAKNVVLFIGDGMTLPMLTAARLLLQSGDRSQTLPTDSFSATGTAFTHSLESIVSDSAAGASALNTGHHTVNGATGAYPDATTGTSHYDTDNPRVETLAEYLRREMGFKVGVVTTASVLDATPAGVWGHGSNRTRYTTLALQGLEMQPDVLLGGGYRWFDPTVNAWQEENYAQDPEVLKRYTDAGYSVLRTDEHLRRHAADATAGSKTLGLFADKAMLTEKDRVVATPPASGQPSLSTMTTAAVEMLTKGDDDRFYLMVEAANIDKAAHACDSARMLSEALALQRAIADTQEMLRQKGLLDDTLLVVTSDHGTGGYDVYGTVDQDKAAATTNGKIRMYGHAEWPDWIADAESMTVGNWHDAQYTFAGMNGNHPAYTEDYKAKDLPVGWLGNNTLLASLEAAGGIPLSNNLGGNVHVDAHNSAVHTATDVMVYANGPGAPRFTGGHPITDVCFSILSALMPPVVPAPTNTDGGNTPAPANQSDALLREIVALRAENAHLRSQHGTLACDASKCAVVSPTVAVLLGVFITALFCLSAVIWRLYATAKATRESRSSTSAHWELEDLAVEGSNASEFGLGGSLTEHTPGL